LAMASRIAETTRFNPGRIAAGLDRGFLDATSLAEYFVTRGVPFRTAHQAVGALVRRCEDLGLQKLWQLSMEQIRAVLVEKGLGPEVCHYDVFEWLEPAKVVKQYQTEGNAGLSGF